MRRLPVWEPPEEDSLDASSLAERQGEVKTTAKFIIRLLYNEVACLFSPVFLCFADVIWWRDVSHNALCHVVNQSQLYAPGDTRVHNNSQGPLYCKLKTLQYERATIPCDLLWASTWSEREKSLLTGRDPEHIREGTFISFSAFLLDNGVKTDFQVYGTHLSLSTVGSVMVRDIMAMRYMWSDTLSGFFTFLYTQPVRGTLCE